MKYSGEQKNLQLLKIKFDTLCRYGAMEFKLQYTDVNTYTL